MKFLIALVVFAPVVALVVGALRGQVRVRSCCAIDAAHDARMAPAYDVTADRAGE
jgi:hypothetical protein